MFQRQTLKNIEGAINNGQFRDTGNIIWAQDIGRKQTKHMFKT